MTIESGTWSVEDTEIIARAVIEAPSVHDAQPWNLRLPSHAAELEERSAFGDVPDPGAFADPGTDTLRPDRFISCGTAVANLELAIRVLGRRTRTVLFPDPDRPTLVARVESHGTSVPTSSDLRLYAAISHRHSHRDAFADVPVPAEVLGDIVAVGTRVPGVTIRLLSSDEAPALADMLTYSAEIKRRNPHYQREMFSWTSHWQPEGNTEIVTTWNATLDDHGAAGEVLITTGIPDTAALADAIDRESVLLLSAESDDPIDLVRIGMATERAWLAAVDARLSASVITHPLRIGDSADRLAARLGMRVPPQLIMRIGY